jgi:hypothetical protein
MSDLTVDLPAPGAIDRAFKFRIPSASIERPVAPSIFGTAPPQRVADAAAASRTPQMPTAASAANPAETTPAKPGKYDPEQDGELCGKILSDFREKMKDIKRAKLGKSSNNALTYERSATKKLVERLAKDYELTEDQVKRIVKLK